MHHGGKWFKGEHEAIVDRQAFEQVQELLKSNVVKCKTKYSESGALLGGKLFDDRGNRMGPSFSSKNGVRYRFYVNTALRGRKHMAGSVTRISAPEIESIVENAVRENFDLVDTSGEAIPERIERVLLSDTLVRITFKSEGQVEGSSFKTLEIQWAPTKDSHTHSPPPSGGKPDQKLLQAVVRAYAWLADLKSGRFSSIDELATTANLHPKVVRQALRLAFLSPALTSAILEGDQPGLTLRQIPKRLPLPWSSHRQPVRVRSAANTGLFCDDGF